MAPVNARNRRLLAVLLLLFCWLLPDARLAAAPGDTPVVDLSHRPGVSQQTRALTLPNNLEVLLVSDPGARTSAAALDVPVGSMEDPAYAPGVAHYLEHMLFLGTRKYPVVGEYGEYLSANQGWSNAWTDATNTNYLFEVVHEAYEGALDRFSQFFIAPLFDPEFMEREKNAVDSEHSKNLQDDFWKRRNVERLTHKPGHPRTSFATGDGKTLKDVTREQVMDFYSRFYSANGMKLVLLGNRSLDELEDLARTYFSEVPDNKRPPLVYDPEVFAPGSLPELLQVKSVGDVHELRLQFALPPQDGDWEAKSLRMIGSLLAHEGEGSLLSYLKSKGLATSIYPQNEDETWCHYYHLVVELTPEGATRWPEVIQAFYDTRALLLKEGLPRWYWAEQKAMGELEYVFREHMEGAQLCSWYANAMQRHPAAEIERRAYLISRYDPQGFKSLLERMTPADLRVVLLGPELGEGTVQIDPDYGTEYIRTPLPADLVRSLEGKRRNREIRFPDPNPYLPDRLALEPAPSPAPEELLPASEGRFWFECNTSFSVPKARLSLLLLSPEPGKGPRERLLANLYARALNESLNEWRYPVLEAGLYLTLRDEARGLRIELDGFSQRLPDLLAALPAKLRELSLDEARFAVLREELARELDNTALDQGYSQCFYEQALLLNPDGIHRDLYRPLVESVTLAEVKAFGERMLARVAIEGAATGNLQKEALRKALLDLRPALGAQALPESERPPRRELVLDPAQARSHVFQTRCNNACWLETTQFGPRSPRLEALLRTGATWLESGFYEELRTRQQLGYIVFSGAALNSLSQGMYFCIQSSVQPATELRQRARTWLESQRAALDSLDEEGFAALKQAIIVQLQQPDKDLMERLNLLETRGLMDQGRFGWKGDVIQALGELSLADFRRDFAPALEAQGGGRLAIYLDAEGAPTSQPLEPGVGAPGEFRRSLPSRTP
jgi:insulysin